MKYTITIRDNETGEIVNSIGCNAIIAGISESDKFSSFAATQCTGNDLLGTLDAAKDAIKSVLNDVPPPIAVHFMKHFAADLLEVIKGEEVDDE